MVCAVSAQAAERSHMKRADETCFFSPPGRSPRQRDEGASSPKSGNVTPSSDPSGHLLPGGEKKYAAPSCEYTSVSKTPPRGITDDPSRHPLHAVSVDLDLQYPVLRDLRPRRLILVHA